LVLGGVAGFEWVLAAAGPPRAGEEGDGWAGSAPTLLGRYACRLWDGLLDHEEVVDR
jgi:hypothetical protein